jgi:hypothetical protein
MTSERFPLTCEKDEFPLSDDLLATMDYIKSLRDYDYKPTDAEKTKMKSSHEEIMDIVREITASTNFILS